MAKVFTLLLIGFADRALTILTIKSLATSAFIAVRSGARSQTYSAVQTRLTLTSVQVLVTIEPFKAWQTDTRVVEARSVHTFGSILASIVGKCTHVNVVLAQASLVASATYTFELSFSLVDTRSCILTRLLQARILFYFASLASVIRTTRALIRVSARRLRVVVIDEKLKTYSLMKTWILQITNMDFFEIFIL